MVEIIVRFPDEKTADKFIGQMMDGVGEDICDFTHWVCVAEGKYEKTYCPEGRLICFVNRIGWDDEEEE